MDDSFESIFITQNRTVDTTIAFDAAVNLLNNSDVSDETLLRETQEIESDISINRTQPKEYIETPSFDIFGNLPHPDEPLRLDAFFDDGVDESKLIQESQKYDAPIPNDRFQSVSEQFIEDMSKKK